MLEVIILSFKKKKENVNVVVEFPIYVNLLIAFNAMLPINIYPRFHLDNRA